MQALTAILGAILAGATATAASEEIPRRDELPLESEGELRFFVDVAGFRGAGGTTEQEIYVSITNDQLAYRPEGEFFEGALRMTVQLRTAEGEEIFSRESMLEPSAVSEFDAGDRGIVQIIRERAAVPPGLCHLEVVILDDRSQKPGLFNRMRNAKNGGEARGWIDVKSLSSEDLVLSDLALVRSARPAPEGSSFGRNGVDFDPNPTRFYGLALAAVRSYLEVYAGGGFEAGDTFLVRTRILDATSGTVAEKISRASPASSAFVVTEELALLPSKIDAGSYFLEVMVLNERTRAEASVQRSFEVLWGVASWNQDPAGLVQEMRLIMSDSEIKTLERLDAGAREIYLAEYWRELDPQPETAENETFVEFRRRVALADRQFEATLQRGILTDRGRVYVRYGPPDDVTYQYSTSSFGMDEESERVAGPGERARLGARPNTSFLEADEFREGDVSDVAAQRGGANIKAKQLEIWEYNGPGRVLSGNQDLGMRSHRGLKFIFADEIGDGNYELIGSSGVTVY